MYKCNHCQAIFEEPVVKRFKEMHEWWGAMVPYEYTEVYCPECGEEDFEEYQEDEEEEE